MDYANDTILEVDGNAMNMTEAFKDALNELAYTVTGPMDTFLDVMGYIFWIVSFVSVFFLACGCFWCCAGKKFVQKRRQRRNNRTKLPEEPPIQKAEAQRLSGIVPDVAQSTVDIDQIAPVDGESSFSPSLTQ